VVAGSGGQGTRVTRTSFPSENCGTKKIAKEPKGSQIARQNFGAKCFSKEPSFWLLSPKVQANRGSLRGMDKTWKMIQQRPRALTNATAKRHRTVPKKS